MRGKFLFALILNICLSPAFAANKDKGIDTKPLVTITEVDAEVAQDQTIIHVQFDGPPSWKNVTEIQDHSSFTQILLPDSIAGMPGKFLDVEGFAVAKVGIFQSSGTSVGIRIFPKSGQKIANDTIKTEVLGSRLIILIGGQPKFGSVPPSLKFVGPPNLPRDEPKVVANLPLESVDTSESAVVNLEVDRKADAQPIAKERIQGIEDKINGLGKPIEAEKNVVDSITVKATLFIVGLILLSLILLTQKKFKMLRDFRQVDLKDSTIINLSSLHVSQKHKLTLIQVGYERFLIGVSPSGISLLTNIDQKQKESNSNTEIVQKGIHQSLGSSQHIEKMNIKPSFIEQLEGPDFEPIEKSRTLEKSSSQINNYVSPKYSKSSSTSNPQQGEKVSLRMESRPNSNDTAPKRLRISIDDEGIKDLSPRREKQAISKISNKEKPNMAKNIENNAIDDVTKLIRDRISGLRKI